jgi:acyl-CoA thioester hydrolase
VSEELRIRIRWRDIDALGHVNNAVYLTYLEELLNAYLEPVLGVDWVTARTELDFRREVRLADGEVVARAAVERVGTSSITLGVVIDLPDGSAALEGRVVAVAWDAEARRSQPLTAEKDSLSSLN